jgi:hypothetical protein
MIFIIIKVFLSLCCIILILSNPGLHIWTVSFLALARQAHSADKVGKVSSFHDTRLISKVEILGLSRACWQIGSYFKNSCAVTRHLTYMR